MEISVSVEDLSNGQKKLQVAIPARKVQQELEKRYRDLARQVRIKGFRPGKVPRSILKSYYGKSVESELSNQFVQETFPDALRQTDLKPLVEADVDHIQFEEQGDFTYSAIVDVCPPFEVPNYKGLKIDKPTVAVGEAQLEQELQRLRDQQAQLVAVEPARPIASGDVALLDFVPSVAGEVFEKGVTTDYMMEVGKQTMHPGFDEHLVGRSAGEAFSFELDYPEDSPTPELAGKKVRFEVTIKDHKLKLMPELNDDLAKELGQHDTLEELKQDLRAKIENAERERLASAVRQQLREQVVSELDLTLSEKIVNREVDRLVGSLQQQFVNQGLQVDTSRLDTPEIRKEYRPHAEQALKWRQLAARIAEIEHLELSDQETEEIYRKVGRMLRMDPEKVRQDYADSSIVESLKDARVQDKVLQLMEEHADYQPAADEAADPGEE